MPREGCQNGTCVRAQCAPVFQMSGTVRCAVPKFGVDMDQLPYVNAMNGVHLHVLMCEPLFHISGSPGRTTLKNDVRPINKSLTQITGRECQLLRKSSDTSFLIASVPFRSFIAQKGTLPVSKDSISLVCPVSGRGSGSSHQRCLLVC